MPPSDSPKPEDFQTIEEALGDLEKNKTSITDEVLRENNSHEALTALDMKLYAEAGVVINTCCGYLTNPKPFERNQAICIGLLVRISKFMRVVLELSAIGPRREIVFALSRCIMESAVNAAYLCHQNSPQLFDQFILHSLGPEKELFDSIQAKIASRSGIILPIETRMLASIENHCRAAGVAITNVPRRTGWGPDLRAKLEALGLDPVSYVTSQRVPSHAVHGTWVDIKAHHLQRLTQRETGEVGYLPDHDFNSVDSRLYGPIAIIALFGADHYVARFLHSDQYADRIRKLIADLDGRIRRIQTADEGLRTEVI